MAFRHSQWGQGHTGVLVSKGGQQTALRHSLVCWWHICGQSLGSQLSISHASLLWRGHTSQGRIMQYLLDTSGSKPASPTPTSPLQYSSMAAVRERDGEVASSFP